MQADGNPHIVHSQCQRDTDEPDKGNRSRAHTASLGTRRCLMVGPGLTFAVWIEENLVKTQLWPVLLDAALKIRSGHRRALGKVGDRRE